MFANNNNSVDTKKIAHGYELPFLPDGVEKSGDSDDSIVSFIDLLSDDSTNINKSDMCSKKLKEPAFFKTESRDLMSNSMIAFGKKVSSADETNDFQRALDAARKKFKNESSTVTGNNSSSTTFSQLENLQDFVLKNITGKKLPRISFDGVYYGHYFHTVRNFGKICRIHIGGKSDNQGKREMMGYYLEYQKNQMYGKISEMFLTLTVWDESCFKVNVPQPMSNCLINNVYSCKVYIEKGEHQIQGSIGSEHEINFKYH
jgi:hypothetical protein